jgi:putative transposase
MTYSLDLREKVVAFIEKGNDCGKAVEIFGVSRDTIFRWLRKKRMKGTIAPQPPSNAPKKCPDQELLNYIKTKNDASLKELATRFQMTPSGIWRSLKRLGVTRKKNRCFIEKGMKVKNKPF